MVLAFAVGATTWVGLELSPRLGGPTFGSPLALATLAGLVQLVPELGAILGLFPALLLLTVDPTRAVTYVAAYVAARLISGRLVGRRGRRPPTSTRPSSSRASSSSASSGRLWLLLSAPILVFAADLVRYLHGRLSEPPRPGRPAARRGRADDGRAAGRGARPSPSSIAAIAPDRRDLLPSPEPVDEVTP